MACHDQQLPNEVRIAVFVDCDNTRPEILEYALKTVTPLGRVVLRRGYGNHTSLTSRWQEALIRLAFTPHLQYQYAPGKNTADIALALDAMEAMFDGRATSFCIVSSDSDFSYLCRKLRERGAVVYIVGESKTPEALRSASDRFFEWVALEGPPPAQAPVPAHPKAPAVKGSNTSPAMKHRPKFLVKAVSLLGCDAPGGEVSLSALSHHLRQADPAFSPKTYGHSGLLAMLKTYDLLKVAQKEGSLWHVSLA